MVPGIPQWNSINGSFQHGINTEEKVSSRGSNEFVNQSMCREIYLATFTFQNFFMGHYRGQLYYLNDSASLSFWNMARHQGGTGEGKSPCPRGVPAAPFGKAGLAQSLSLHGSQKKAFESHQNTP